MDLAAAVPLDLAGRDERDHFVWVGGGLHVRETFGPRCRAHEPHEREDGSDPQVLKGTEDRGQGTQGTPRSCRTHTHTVREVRGPRTHNQWALVVLLVLLVEEDVDAEGSGGVEEAKHADGDKELGRGGVVADQEETLFVIPPTGGGVKVHLVESGGVGGV